MSSRRPESRARWLTGYYLQRMGLVVGSRTLVFFEKATGNAENTIDPVIEVLPLTLEELEGSGEFSGWLTREEGLHHLRTRDCSCFVAKRNRAIVGNCWIEYDYVDLGFFDIKARLQPDSAYIAHVFVDRAARNRGIARAMISAALSQARARGRRRAVLCCVPENDPMIKIMAELGWSRYQLVTYHRALFLRRYRLRSETGHGKETAWGRDFICRELMRWGSA